MSEIRVTIHDLVEQRIPLLPRSKPVCRSFTDRIDRVRRQADLASQHTDDSLLRAAEAHNLAALIVSDCGMPALGRNLCWRQFDIFATSGPYDQATAKLTRQPLVNLGRRQDYLLGNIVHRGDDHREIVQWLWTILLADGIRALCRAGR